MAFKMNRPIIEGTEDHKASVAKAISGEALMRGAKDAVYVPKIKTPKNKKKKPEPEKKKEKKEEKKPESKLIPVKPKDAPQYEDQAQRLEDKKEVSKILKEDVGNQTSGGAEIHSSLAGNDYNYSYSSNVLGEDPALEGAYTPPSEEENVEEESTPGQYLTQEDINFMNEQARGEGFNVPDDEEGGEDGEDEEGGGGGGDKEGGDGDGSDGGSDGGGDGGSSSGGGKGSAATKKQNRRIWRNARKGGPVRKNMLKSGYKPK